MPKKKVVSQKQKKQDDRVQISSIISSKEPSRLKEVNFDDFRYTYKDHSTSLEKGLYWIYRCASRDTCKVLLHISVDFDFAKYCSTTSEDMPEIKGFASSKVPAFAGSPTETCIHATSWPHSCIESKPIPTTVKIDSSKDGRMDRDYFEKLIEANPYSSLLQLKTLADISDKAYKERTLKEMILNYRKIAFPTEESHILNNSYCKTLDKNPLDQLDFYLGKGEIIIKEGKSCRYVILGTKFSLRILAKTPRWFLDGTFKMVPTGFSQVYMFLSKYEGFTLPCIYLFLSSKDEALYTCAFSHIKSLCQDYKYKIEATAVMMDYELAARNAIQSVFPKLQLKDDYFHFTKCLWKRAKTEKLCGESLIDETCLLIPFLQILIHIGKEDRTEYFDDIKECFLKKSKAFKGFLTYFENNWLSEAFINFKSEDKDELADRTNNLCESFNSIFNKHMRVRRAPLAVFISKLKELEFVYRQRVLKNIAQGIEHVNIETPNLDKLPFSKIYDYLEKQEKQINEARYNLRSSTLKNDFLDKLSDLGKDCYNYFFIEDEDEDPSVEDSVQPNTSENDFEGLEDTFNEQSSRSSQRKRARESSQYSQEEFISETKGIKLNDEENKYDNSLVTISVRK